ncbi:hypothetical protein ABC484_001753 [Escherichia coli]|uniref:hypothetical protein n=1 Tax=Escherichia coli TaxID=562 RepID=UPI0012394C85|nr:hypothetical protein [Escherichia coli]EER5314982.1 hypothetical protein [Escherichia coli]EER9960339.1 hypothetical protein [Escherichia coli]EES0050578.1 hypothetical protein [Escherichia coli]EES0191105.1 hypothetical protein [Escherichia coli]EFE0140400.1 hypothetical protein [Escherichia coli]
MRKFWNVSFFGDGELMVPEAIWLLLQCDKLWQSWLVAKNFDDWGAQNKTGSASVDQMRSEKSETRLTV